MDDRTEDVESLRRRARQQAADLRAHRADAARTKADLRGTVAALRAAGDTWDEIGRLLGITRQGAARIYGRDQT